MKTEALEVLENRRSIRKFKPEQVSEEELQLVMRAGTYAPTGKNTQGVQIVAVRTPEYVAEVDRLNALAWGRPNIHPYYGAPTIILIFETEGCITPMLDGAAACMNMLNAAYAIGLGGCWINRSKEVFETEEGKALLREWGLPDNMRGVASIALGYPARKNPKPFPRHDGYFVEV